FRVRLLKLDETDHVLTLTLHHIVTDGWSMRILRREISAVYAALVGGRPSPLAPLPVQYSDYARLQRQLLEGEVCEQQLAYWRRKLAGITPLELPTDRPRPAVQSFRGIRHPVVLERALGGAGQAPRPRGGGAPLLTPLA